MSFLGSTLFRLSHPGQADDRAASTGGLLFDQRGTTAVEYALMNAIVVGSMLAVTRFADSVASAIHGTQSIGNPSGIGYWRLFAEVLTISVICVLLVLVRRRKGNFFDFSGGLFSSESKSRAQLEAARQRLYSKRQAILRAVSADSAALFRSRLDIGHLVTPNVTRVSPDATAKKVAKLMQTERLRHVMVCDASESLVGVISDRDLRKTDARTAAELMTPNPITVSPEDLIGPAVTSMMNRNISCLPVLDEGRLVGVLTTTDLMMALQCCLQVLQAAATEESNPAVDSPNEIQEPQVAGV